MKFLKREKKYVTLKVKFQLPHFESVTSSTVMAMISFLNKERPPCT